MFVSLCLFYYTVFIYFWLCVVLVSVSLFIGSYLSVCLFFALLFMCVVFVSVCRSRIPDILTWLSTSASFLAESQLVSKSFNRWNTLSNLSLRKLTLCRSSLIIFLIGPNFSPGIHSKIATKAVSVRGLSSITCKQHGYHTQKLKSNRAQKFIARQLSGLLINPMFVCLCVLYCKCVPYLLHRVCLFVCLSILCFLVPYSLHRVCLSMLPVCFLVHYLLHRICLFVCLSMSCFIVPYVCLSLLCFLVPYLLHRVCLFVCLLMCSVCLCLVYYMVFVCLFVCVLCCINL